MAKHSSLPVWLHNPILQNGVKILPKHKQNCCCVRKGFSEPHGCLWYWADTELLHCALALILRLLQDKQPKSQWDHQKEKEGNIGINKIRNKKTQGPTSEACVSCCYSLMLRVLGQVNSMNKNSEDILSLVRLVTVCGNLFSSWKSDEKTDTTHVCTANMKLQPTAS